MRESCGKNVRADSKEIALKQGVEVVELSAAEKKQFSGGGHGQCMKSIARTTWT